MSHITDPNVSVYRPAAPLYQAAVSAGSATLSQVKTGALWYLRVLAGAGGAELEVKWTCSPGLGQGERSQRGFCLKGLDFWYYVSTNVTTLDLALYLLSLPGDGAAWAAATAQAFSYDAAHDTNGERVAGGYHKVSCTATAPAWIGSSQALQYKAALILGANGEIYLFGARLRGRLRT